MTRLRLAAMPIIASGFCTVFLMYQALSPAVSSPVASPVAGPEIKALHCAVIGQGHCLQSSYMNLVSHRQPGQLALWKLGDFEMDADGKTLQERFKVVPRRQKVRMTGMRRVCWTAISANGSSSSLLRSGIIGGWQ